VLGPVPPGGWIRAVRDALGMSTMELGVRLNVTRERVSQLERAEERRSIPLSTLDRVAAAMRCRVLYVLVPDDPLEQLVRRQALEQAARELGAPPAAQGDYDEHYLGSLDDEAAARIEARAHDLVDRRGLWAPVRRRAAEEGA
jgi:predicted DNA-binding mobile mystery protein A